MCILRFVGEVSNPDEILHFIKKKKEVKRAGAGGQQSELLIENAPESIGDQGQAQIQDLIFNYFSDSSSNLELLPEPDFNIAVQKFVHQADSSAIAQFLANSLEQSCMAVAQSKAVEVDDITQEFKVRTDKMREKSTY
tara:strand:- start:427 stop:840 length:414 start_codon:yes stop_codon:yes gene_type:complete